jgi:hypothetical protein
MEGVTKFRAEMEGRTIQRLPHPGIHSINNHKTQTLLHMPARFLLKGPWYSYLLWGYANAWQIQKWMLTVSYWMEHRAPNGGARESTEGSKGVHPLGGTTIWTNQPSRAHVSSCICSRRWPSQPSLGREARWSYKLYMSQYRGIAGPRSGSGWIGEWGRGRVWGIFSIAFEM